jgi:hypothetical protein
MASAFGQGEQHDVMGQGCCNGRVSGPVVSQVMDVTPSCHKLSTNLPTWIVRRSDHFYEGFTAFRLECLGVPSPVEQLRLQVVDCLRIALADYFSKTC